MRTTKRALLGRPWVRSPVLLTCTCLSQKGWCATDWSSLDRLERLLQKAGQTGAELAGTQELMLLQDGLLMNLYPLDVNRALSSRHGYSLLHPSSLVSRSLVTRLGGYAAGLRFSGDIEFLARAHFRAKIVNLDRYCYFRRLRVDSLITSQATGLGSTARQALDARIAQRAAENSRRAGQGKNLLLEPLEKSDPVPLEKITGPKLTAPPGDV